MTEIFEPYIVLSALLVAPVAWSFRRPAGRAAVLLLVAITLVRYVPAWASLPATPGGEQIRVMTWNLLSSPSSGERALEGILRSEADIIGVQELLPPAAEALAADSTLLGRLPHRVLAPERTVRGMGLLSRYPIVEQQTWTEPPMLRAVVEHPALGRLSVFVVHPLPASFRTVARVPVSFDSTRRDADIAWIRSVIDADAAAGRPILVIGDLNTTEREPAYAEFAAGMYDAHLEAGVGPGFTWLPESLGSLPFGLLRIDYIFGMGGFVPVSTFVDCSLPSDHCRLEAALAL